MKQRACPLCHTLPSSTQAVNLETVPCDNCGLVWTLIEESIEADSLYTDDVYQVVDNRGSLFEKIIFREALMVLTRARRFLGDRPGQLLDFGCGKGQFLKQARDSGWQGVGVETSKERAKFARRQYGLEVLGSFYESGVIGAGNFDLITLNHVLEHLPCPMELLDELLQKNLAPGGIAYLEVPRLDSWQSAIGGKAWMHLDVPKHLTHWTSAQFICALGELGYQVVAQRRFSFHLGVLGMLQAMGTRLGYVDNIIVDLKRRRSPKLILLLVTLTPVALSMELLACLFGRSGIMGFFVRRVSR